MERIRLCCSGYWLAGHVVLPSGAPWQASIDASLPHLSIVQQVQRLEADFEVAASCHPRGLKCRRDIADCNLYLRDARGRVFLEMVAKVGLS